MASETKVVSGLRVDGGDYHFFLLAFQLSMSLNLVGGGCETGDFFFLAFVAEACRGLGFKVAFPIPYTYWVTTELTFLAGT